MKLIATLLGLSQAMKIKENHLLAEVDASQAAPDAFNQMHLDKHNEYRAAHGAEPLVYDEQLAIASQQWSQTQSDADNMWHDPDNQFGENLAMYWNSNSAAMTQMNEYTTHATDAWYNEVTDPGYDFNTPGSQSGTGHFTQVVWKGSQRLGCGVVGKYTTCRYDPPGNYTNSG